MSIKIMSKVFNLDIKSTEKFVLLAISDCANDDGIAYPSITTIQRKTSLSRRCVIKCISTLMDMNFLSKIEGFTTPRKCKSNQNFYQILVHEDNQLPRCTSEPHAPELVHEGNQQLVHEVHLESSIGTINRITNNKTPIIPCEEKPKNPKRNTKLEKQKFAKAVKGQWHKSVVQNGIKQKSTGIGVTDTDINNIQRIVQYTTDEGSSMDYKTMDAWLNYFNELFRICNRKIYLQKCIKSFSWAVKPTTYQKLGDDTYLNLEEVA